MKLNKFHYGNSKVLCGGKFNSIHKGHVYFLKQAKKLADKLVVVVANDTHNNRYYAKPQILRKKSVESTFIADKVIIGNPKGFLKTVMKEKPAMIALGYDQKLPGDCLNYVRNHNIRIVIIKKLGNYSTSSVVKR